MVSVVGRIGRRCAAIMPLQFPAPWQNSSPADRVDSLGTLAGNLTRLARQMIESNARAGGFPAS